MKNIKIIAVIIFMLAIASKEALYGMTQPCLPYEVRERHVRPIDKAWDKLRLNEGRSEARSREVKRDSAAAADTKAVKAAEHVAEPVAYSHLPQGIESTIEAYVSFWDWLPAVKINKTVLAEDAGSVSSLIKLDEHLIASSSYGYCHISYDNRNIKIWDIKKEEVATLEAHEGDVTSLIKLDDRRMASSSFRLSGNMGPVNIKIWDLSTSQVTALKGHKASVLSLVTLDNNRIASSSYAEIKIWDLAMPEKPIVTLEVKGRGRPPIYPLTALRVRLPIYSLTALDEYHLACRYDGVIMILDLRKPERPIAILQDKKDVISLLKLDKHIIAAGYEDHTIKIWDLTKPAEPITILKGHEGAVLSLIKLDEHHMASGSADGTIKIWDLTKPEKPITTFEGQGSAVVSLLKLDEYTIASGHQDGTIVKWEVAKEQLAKIYAALRGDAIGNVIPLNADTHVPEPETTSIASADVSVAQQEAVSVSVAPVAPAVQQEAAVQEPASAKAIESKNNLCTIL